MSGSRGPSALRALGAGGPGGLPPSVAELHSPIPRREERAQSVGQTPCDVSWREMELDEFKAGILASL